MKVRWIILAVLLAFGLMACRQSPKEEVSGDYVTGDGTTCYRGELSNDLRVHFVSEPSSLHPTNTINTYYHIIRPYIQQRLLGLDIKTGELEPELLKGLPEVSEDGLLNTFELHPDAKWNDGAPITSEDVAFSIKAVLCPLTDNNAIRSYFESIAEVRTFPEDPRKFQFQMAEVYILNPYMPTDIVILDRRFYDPENVLSGFSLKDFSENPESVKQNGALKAWAANFNDAKYGREIEFLGGTTGPYVLTEWTPGQQLVISRNENYWGKGLEGNIHAQGPDRIFFRIIKDDVPTELEFKQQAMDVSFNLSTPVYEALQESEVAQQNYKMDALPRDSYTYIGMNTRPDGVRHKRIFDDKQVRKAMAFLTPADEILEQLYGNGGGVRTMSPVSMHGKDYNQSLKPIPFDPEKASELLTAAGWSDTDNDRILDKVIDGVKTPLRFELLYPGGRQSVIDIVDRIVTAWQNAGIDCQPNGVELNVIREKMNSHDFDAVLAASSTHHLPYDFKQIWHTSNWLSGGDNWTGFGNARSDELIDASRRELDPVKRKAMVDELQQMIYDEQPLIFLMTPTTKVAIHKRFQHAEMYRLRYYVMLNRLEVVRCD
jgi:peptide/nickel transport system substrate-binding protein